MQRSICRKCGYPIAIVEGTAPDIRCLQYGLFDDAVKLPKPGLELFRSRAVEWCPILGKDVRETQKGIVGRYWIGVREDMKASTQLKLESGTYRSILYELRC
jgi:hypothetical protein